MLSYVLVLRDFQGCVLYYGQFFTISSSNFPLYIYLSVLNILFNTNVSQGLNFSHQL